MKLDFQMTDEDIQKMAGVLMAVLLPEIEKTDKQNPNQTDEQTGSNRISARGIPGIVRRNMKKT